MSILSQTINIPGLGLFTNADVVDYYNLQYDIDDIGCLYHVRSGNYVGHLNDYRTKFMKDMQKKQNQKAYQTKRAAMLKEQMPEIVEVMRSDLYGVYGDKAFINRSQPNVNFEEYGLKVYVICGWTHRVTFLHDEYTTDELNAILGWKSVTIAEETPKSIVCNGLKDSNEIIQLINTMVETLKEGYK